MLHAAIYIYHFLHYRILLYDYAIYSFWFQKVKKDTRIFVCSSTKNKINKVRIHIAESIELNMLQMNINGFSARRTNLIYKPNCAFSTSSRLRFSSIIFSPLRISKWSGKQWHAFTSNVLIENCFCHSSCLFSLKLTTRATFKGVLNTHKTQANEILSDSGATVLKGNNVLYMQQEMQSEPTTSVFIGNQKMFYNQMTPHKQHQYKYKLSSVSFRMIHNSYANEEQQKWKDYIL